MDKEHSGRSDLESDCCDTVNISYSAHCTVGVECRHLEFPLKKCNEFQNIDEPFLPILDIFFSLSSKNFIVQS